MNAGDLVKVTYKGDTGVGYIYNNNSVEEPWLAIGISWAKGGTSNTSLKDALESGAEIENFKIVSTDAYQPSTHKPFVDEWGNTDWRDTGEMGG